MAPRKRVPVEDRPIYERAAWTSDADKVSRRMRRWRAKNWFDRTAGAFALSKPRAGNNDTEDGFWEVRRLVDFSIYTFSPRRPYILTRHIVYRDAGSWIIWNGGKVDKV